MRDLEALKMKIGKTPEEDRLVVVIIDYLEQLGDLKKRMSKLDQNHLIKNPILFRKYLSPQKLLKNV